MYDKKKRTENQSKFVCQATLMHNMYKNVACS